MMDRVKRIEDYLCELYPDAHCELIYKKDYELLISVMLSAQTTDKKVNKVTPILFSKYDSLDKLKNADVDDIAMIIKSLGTFNRKAHYVKEIARILVDEYNGQMPMKRNLLEALPGVGRKTVNVVFGELGVEPTIAVDTHVLRVSKRLGLAKENDDVLAVERKLKKKISRENWVFRHHQLIFFGRYHCKALCPNCNNCKLYDICKFYKEKE